MAKSWSMSSTGLTSTCSACAAGNLLLADVDDIAGLWRPAQALG